MYLPHMVEMEMHNVVVDLHDILQKFFINNVGMETDNLVLKYSHGIHNTRV